MASPSVVMNISLSTEAGVSKKIKTGDSPLRIYDLFHVANASEPIGSHVIRTKNKVDSVAGVLRGKVSRNFSIANRY